MCPCFVVVALVFVLFIFQLWFQNVALANLTSPRWFQYQICLCSQVLGLQVHATTPALFYTIVTVCYSVWEPHCLATHSLSSLYLFLSTDVSIGVHSTGPSHSFLSVV